MERREAIFHEHQRADDALRALTAQGIAREGIAMSSRPHREPMPHSLFGLPHRVHYTGVGAAAGMIVGLALSGRPGSTAPTALWLVIVSTFVGGLIGLGVGLVVGGLKKERWRQRLHRDWILHVETASSDEARRAEETMLRCGGEIVEPA